MANAFNASISFERRQTVLAGCVASVAGYLDAYALMKLGIFVSFMSGNTTMAGLRTGEGHFLPALAPAIAIPAFVGGSFTGTLITSWSKPYANRVIFLVNALLICMVMMFGGHESLKIASIIVLSSATGLLNPALSRVGLESVSLTFVTGTLSRLGGHLASAAKGIPLSGAEDTWDSHLRRAFLDAYIWAGFLAGAVLSGILIKREPQTVLPIAIAVMAALGLFGRVADATTQQGSELRKKHGEHDRSKADSDT
jgi:uncharacterized membrane protein YoaK (UPF0700 family)